MKRVHNIVSHSPLSLIQLLLIFLYKYHQSSMKQDVEYTILLKILYYKNSITIILDKLICLIVVEIH